MQWLPNTVSLTFNSNPSNTKLSRQSPSQYCRLPVFTNLEVSTEHTSFQQSSLDLRSLELVCSGLAIPHCVQRPFVLRSRNATTVLEMSNWRRWPTGRSLTSSVDVGTRGGGSGKVNITHWVISLCHCLINGCTCTQHTQTYPHNTRTQHTESHSLSCTTLESFSIWYAQERSHSVLPETHLYTSGIKQINVD